MPTTFPLGTSVFYVDTVNPSATDDIDTIGARRGYWWLNTSDSSVHICINSDIGVAVWQEVTPSARNVNTGTGLTGGGSLNSDLTIALTGVAEKLHTYTSGPGTGPLELPRVSDLGTAAFADVYSLGGIFVVDQTSNYTISLTDFRKMIVASASTLTFTLPLAANVPYGWSCMIKNRSGNGLTIARAGSDTLNSGVTSVSVASSSAVSFVAKMSNTSFEVA